MSLTIKANSDQVVELTGNVCAMVMTGKLTNSGMALYHELADGRSCARSLRRGTAVGRGVVVRRQGRRVMSIRWQGVVYDRRR